MALEARVQDELKAAMRGGDAVARDTLRMLLAALKNRRIELGRDLDDAEGVAVVAKAVKTREESAATYDGAGRDDLAAKERAEIEVLRGFLPRQLSEDETRALVDEAVRATGASSKADLGGVMKHVMAGHRGRVDGKLVQRLAAERLS